MWRLSRAPCVSCFLAVSLHAAGNAAAPHEGHQPMAPGQGQPGQAGVAQSTAPSMRLSLNFSGVKRLLD